MIRYKGLFLETSPEVYDPAEDSFLLAEALDAREGESVLDVGTGTGLLALLAAKAGAQVLAVDLNPAALDLAGKNAEKNNLEVEFRLSDLFEKVPERFDLIVFNPPYVPADEYDTLGKAWSGGKDGRETIDRFVKEAGCRLKPGGRILLLFSSHNILSGVREICESSGLSFEVIAEKKLFFEVLYVARCYLTD